MNAMYEVQPWPGVLFRCSTVRDQMEFDSNGGNKSFKKTYNMTDSGPKTVLIKRVNGIVYMSIDGEELVEGPNHTNITTLTTNVTFGSSLTSNNVPQRYFKGALKRMSVILY